MFSDYIPAYRRGKSMNEIDDLKQSFLRRTRNGKKYNKEVTDKLIQSYANGFKCPYCNCTMLIESGHSTSYTIDHRISRSLNNGSDLVDNIDFICCGCNFFKGAMSAGEYKQIVDAIVSKHGYEFLINTLAHRHRYSNIQKSYKKPKNKKWENEEKRHKHLFKLIERKCMICV